MGAFLGKISGYHTVLRSSHSFINVEWTGSLMMVRMNEWIDMMKWHGWPTKGVKLIVSRNSCQRLWPSWIHDPPRPGFEPAYNQTLSFVEWSVLWNNHSFNYVVWVGSWCNWTWFSSIESGFFWKFWTSWILLQRHLMWNLCMHPKFIRLKTT